MKREKHHAKQRAPAAALIQSLWRLGASRSKDSSTWPAGPSARAAARAATGRLRNGFKAHDGEVLTLTAVNSTHFVSTSLDQTASGWRWEDGRLAANLSAPSEPVHCVAAHADTEVVLGSTANRVTVQKAVETEAAATTSRLRAELIKGHLTALAVLHLNRQLLLGTDQGTVHLVC